VCVCVCECGRETSIMRRLCPVAVASWGGLGMSSSCEIGGSAN